MNLLSRSTVTRPADLGAVQRSASGRKHYPELDALREAAALVVLFNHFLQIWLGTSHPRWISHPKFNPLLWLLVNGHASVILFFLLSGFVFTLPSLRGSQQSYLRYLVRRVCRIYPPYLAGLLLSVIGCVYFWGHTEYGPEFAQFWTAPPDVRSLGSHLLMIGRYNVYRYDGPIWSLVHEMRISILFPPILLLARRLQMWSALAIAACCTVLSSLSLVYLETGLPSTVRPTAWSLTLSYGGTFLLGAALAHRREAYGRALDQARVTTRVVLLACGFALYLYPPSSVCGVDVSDFVTSCGGCCCLRFACNRAAGGRSGYAQPHTVFGAYFVQHVPSAPAGAIGVSVCTAQAQPRLVSAAVPYPLHPSGHLCLPQRRSAQHCAWPHDWICTTGEEVGRVVCSTKCAADATHVAAGNQHALVGGCNRQGGCTIVSWLSCTRVSSGIPRVFLCNRLDGTFL